MGENTKIPWAHHTFNAWIGCTHVSPECDNCYAELMSKFRGWATWGKGQERHRTSDANWCKPLKWNKEARSLGVRYRVFCSSLSDVFDPEVPYQWRNELFDLISATSHLDWLLLTKRPGIMRQYLNALPSAPWPNVWAMVSAGCQRSADAFLPILADVNAIVHGVSCEPILEYVNFKPWAMHLDWIIVGAESGPKHRPAQLDWFRRIRDDCQTTGTYFFMKQFVDSRGQKIETPELDGRQWMEFPRS